ncbi:hypothetical protein SAMN06265355_101246 [Actinomadura mexicana]|uniref:Transposase IS116/IS110/IS902 family protein n=1 Tax=Actinomadura mexicana TaxID=134959 RepID=A0A238UPV6_9ACTN|nr:hypothetical protein SAMN06265355_101246 [Actinomadura mexicana]
MAVIGILRVESVNQGLVALHEAVADRPIHQFGCQASLYRSRSGRFAADWRCTGSSALAAVHDPASRTYYNCCRARGEPQPQALLRLARHRISVLFAKLRDNTLYEPRTPRLT